MSFIEVMKDKKGSKRATNVFHRGDEGQKSVGKRGICPSYG
ncbi:hypothetical protein EV207_11582 [Scopulibacillus darangshiensis]|uniref:Uncharacterized protein n=1 Tax=Scopulibacillus darangshiensis TaxID=442528 RepID=A0A4V2SMW4_9BACL|nr:hypothetical protein EV207_11582 [Scopulibacillus darangshiensis]